MCFFEDDGVFHSERPALSFLLPYFMKTEDSTHFKLAMVCLRTLEKTEFQKGLLVRSKIIIPYMQILPIPAELSTDGRSTGALQRTDETKKVLLSHWQCLKAIGGWEGHLEERLGLLMLF